MKKFDKNPGYLLRKKNKYSSICVDNSYQNNKKKIF